MKKHILCIGDSNTHGLCTDPSESADHGSRYNEEERWTCLLQKALGAEYLVIEEGLSGRTCVYDDPDMDSAGCNDDCSGSYLGIHFFLQIQRIIKFVSGSAAYCTSEVASGSASGTSVSGNYVYLAESWYADVDHFKWSAVHFRRTI